VLYAGLYPFHVPPNEVEWIGSVNGLRFGEHASIRSTRPFAAPEHGGRTIELWIEPGITDDSNTILAFDSPSSPRGLAFSQSDSDLEIRIESSSAWRHETSSKLYIDNAFRGGGPAFWTVVFGPFGTEVFKNGKIIRWAQLKATGNEMSGQLLVGNSAIFSNSWSGTLRGLAIYDSALTPSQVWQHFVGWTSRGAPQIAPGDVCTALYLFDEHNGAIAHSRAGIQNDLEIPSRFTVLRKTTLDPVWRAFNWGRGFWEDALINVTGFVPFGCLFCAYFSDRGVRSPMLCAIIVGVAASTTIELGQVFLPTRDSSMDDLINNSLGAALGAALYRGRLPARSTPA
jgi:hypothetical protein